MLFEALLGIRKYERKIEELEKLIEQASKMKPEYVQTKPMDESNPAYWLKITEFFESDEFQDFIQKMESESIIELCRDNKDLEHKAMFLAGIRKVPQKMSQARSNYERLIAEKEA